MALALAAKQLRVPAVLRGTLQLAKLWGPGSTCTRGLRIATAPAVFSKKNNNGHSGQKSQQHSFDQQCRRDDAFLVVAAGGFTACFFSWQSKRSSSNRDSRICYCAATAPAATSEVYVWGTNIDGQLGVGSTLSVPLPAILSSVPLKPKERVLAVSGGSRHSACVTSEGRVFAWGRGAGGDAGGPTAAEGPREVVVPLQEGDKAVAVSCGSNHTLVVTQTGALYSWGSNTHGQCGRPPIICPQDAAGDRASSPYHVEGIGYRDVFRGRAAHSSSLPPGRVGGSLAGRKVIGASCGDRISAAVTEDGDVFVWGEARGGGSLGGAASKVDYQYEPRLVCLAPEGRDAGGATGRKARAVAVACGESHCLALSSEGRVYAWGSNAYGQLGLGGAFRRIEKPQVVTALSEHRVVAIACGALHSLCLTEEGTVFVWGYGRDGQCAQGSRLDVPLPLQVEVGGPSGGVLGGPEMGPCTQISGGEGHSLAVCGAGKLFMWGRGREGQLGRGGLIESPAASRDNPVEVRVANGRQVAAAACGGCHTIVCTKPASA